MKDFTKQIIKEEKKDIISIYSHNNSKEAKMNKAQIKQAYTDKYNYYNKKWNNYLSCCETEAQKEHCNHVLSLLHVITDRMNCLLK